MTHKTKGYAVWSRDARDIGGVARGIREGLGLTLTAAARRSGTSRQTLARVERGERWLDPFLQRAMVAAYAGVLLEGQATR